MTTQMHVADTCPRENIHRMIDIVSYRLIRAERRGCSPDMLRDAQNAALVLWNEGKTLDEIADHLDHILPLQH